MTNIGDIGETALVKRILEQLGDGQAIAGDDAAICPPSLGGYVFATDSLVENVDFDFAWATWRDVGAKVAAVNLSDMAAMGARPKSLVLTLGCRRDDRVADLLRLVRSAVRVCKTHGAMIVGGDITSTKGPLFVTLAATGDVDVRYAPLRRYRGTPGDVIMVSGDLGGAAAGLLCLQHGMKNHRALVKRQLQPTPRVALGLALGRSGLVSSCTDISDGLASDLAHVIAPGCGAEIDLNTIPLARGVRAVAKKFDRTPLALALAGGEDFELLWTMPPSFVKRLMQRLDVKVSVIGRIVNKPGIVWHGDGCEIPKHGFEHFGVQS